MKPIGEKQMTPEADERLAIEIELFGYSAHLVDWIEHCRQVGESIVRRGKRVCSDSNKSRRTRKPSVARVIQQMKRAGVEVAGCEINPRDGTVRVIAGKPNEAATPDNGTGNEWDSVLQ